MTRLPRVVKFSGGRSSGMLLLNLLRGGELDPAEGDVVVFNNTTAEHAETYSFVQRLKEETEREFRVPFFMLEFCTYEWKMSSKSWVRRPSYKLVKGCPRSWRCKDGFRSNGEAFEEMISWRSFLPSRHTRVCTEYLKIRTTREFLRDWFQDGVSNGEALGPFDRRRHITDEMLFEAHQQNRGEVPKDVYLRKKAYLQRCKPYRASQRYEDYTQGSVHGYGRWREEDGEYVSYLGIRADEPRRVARIKTNVEPGERVELPLADQGVTQRDVIEFWRKQSFNLKLPETGAYSNCVFCFLKSPRKLLQLAADDGNAKALKWWSDIEQNYTRDRLEEGREYKLGKRFQGFWGAEGGLVYPDLRSRALAKQKAGALEDNPDLFSEEEDGLPCNCMD